MLLKLTEHLSLAAQTNSRTSVGHMEALQSCFLKTQTENNGFEKHLQQAEIYFIMSYSRNTHIHWNVSVNY